MHISAATYAHALLHCNGCFNFVHVQCVRVCVCAILIVLRRFVSSRLKTQRRYSYVRLLPYICVCVCVYEINVPLPHYDSLHG